MWICLGRGCQLGLGMCECLHVCVGLSRGGAEWMGEGCRRSHELGRALWEKEWLEAYLDLFPDWGVQLMAPGCIPPSCALFGWLYPYESLLTPEFNFSVFQMLLQTCWSFSNWLLIKMLGLLSQNWAVVFAASRKTLDFGSYWKPGLELSYSKSVAQQQNSTFF